MPKFEEYSEVAIATDRFAERGVPRGSKAIVLEVYTDSAYEVQIFDAGGDTIGLFAVDEHDLSPVTAG